MALASMLIAALLRTLLTMLVAEKNNQGKPFAAADDLLFPKLFYKLSFFLQQRTTIRLIDRPKMPATTKSVA